MLPPKHAPKAKAHTNGCRGKFNAFFSANEMAILTIIVVRGMLSTKADAIADTWKTSSELLKTTNQEISASERSKRLANVNSSFGEFEKSLKILFS